MSPRLSLAVGLLAVGCTCRPDPNAPSDHYVGVEALRAHLIRGDLAAVRDAARQLDGGERVEAPERIEHAEALHGAVGMIVASVDLEEAGWGVAGVAAACGECHRAAGFGLIRGFGADPLNPPDGVEHAYAEEKMWQGLIIPLDATAAHGAQGWISMMQEMAGSSGPQAERAQAAVIRERDAESVFGAALASCAGCHKEAGVTLSPVQAAPVP